MKRCGICWDELDSELYFIKMSRKDSDETKTRNLSVCKNCYNAINDEINNRIIMCSSRLPADDKYNLFKSQVYTKEESDE